MAQWCLDTAVDYAKVREQFGAPIGSFQAVKHLCAEMLETTESVAAVAWDVGAALGRTPTEQADFAADVAATVALDGAVAVAQDCIQVLGGIGFTFEHDAHLYLRRAIALRSMAGRADWRCRASAAAWPDAPSPEQRRAARDRLRRTRTSEFREPTRAARSTRSPRCPRTSSGPRSPRPAT